ncbi:exodeoxyribonuclease VII small subunit [Pacificibacter maritimus]|uniref:Exodeoxyribonuclease 7 small subunit n=1 Tax=Pacificibacter maritimus TaxID=762213 RepID=A0A3N4USV4_9RHOB|nr:exodeoxyribonuclease VII small subunit [Pacificibacter maritimus]RPE64770.1 exodeoxyribonuclease VII small subunit [Pacificibacter maritimus]
MTETSVSEMSFEVAMNELDQVVAKLERGEVALEDSINLYKRGAELKAHCEAKLKDAEEKVEKISVGADGKPVTAQAVEGL